MFVVLPEVSPKAAASTVSKAAVGLVVPIPTLPLVGNVFVYAAAPAAKAAMQNGTPPNRFRMVVESLRCRVAHSNLRLPWLNFYASRPSLACDKANSFVRIPRANLEVAGRSY